MLTRAWPHVSCAFSQKPVFRPFSALEVSTNEQLKEDAENSTRYLGNIFSSVLDYSILIICYFTYTPQGSKLIDFPVFIAFPNCY